MSRFFFAFIPLFFVFVPALKATHIVGGEMTYRCLGNNQYEITLVIFRDCFYGNPAAWFDDPASIGVFNSANVLVQAIPVRPMGNDTLQPVLSSECFVAPPNVCVHTTTYRTTVQLPPIAGGYTLAYQRCCRNQTIVNIVNPLATGATYSVTISESALLQCNNSPTFSQWPPIYICAGVPILFDHSATDADGDSIVYRLCEPLQGANQINPMPQPPNPPPYLPVNWVNPPYNVNNMLNGTPGDPPLSIHPVTGLLTGFPNTVGQFVVGICVEEYRNGQLIGTLRRDFQYNVGVCGQTTSAFFAPELQCGDLRVNFQNQSNNASSFLWFFNDPGNPGATSNEANPAFTFSDTGTYTIMLIAEPGTVCQDTAYRVIRLAPNSLFPGFDIDPGPCSDSVSIQITDMSFDTVSSIVSRSWRLLPGGQTASGMAPSFLLTESGQYTLELAVVAENGCKQSYAENFEIDLIEAEPPPPVSICLGDTATLRVNNPGNGPLTYSWQPAQEILAGAGTATVRVSPATSATISVTIQNQAGCSKTFAVPVDVANIIPPLAVTADPDTIAPGEIAQLEATPDPSYTYTWSPAGTLDNPGIQNPRATPSVTTTYTVRVRDARGCSNIATVTVVVRSPVCDWPNIYVPNGFSPNGDGRNDVLYVRGNGIDDLYFVVYDRWGEKVFETHSQSIGWDGRFRGKALNSDVYAYYLRARCFNGEEYVHKGNVTLLR